VNQESENSSIRCSASCCSGSAGCPRESGFCFPWLIRRSYDRMIVLMSTRGRYHQTCDVVDCTAAGSWCTKTVDKCRPRAGGTLVAESVEAGDGDQLSEKTAGTRTPQGPGDVGCRFVLRFTVSIDTVLDPRCWDHVCDIAKKLEGFWGEELEGVCVA